MFRTRVTKCDFFLIGLLLFVTVILALFRISTCRSDSTENYLLIHTSEGDSLYALSLDRDISVESNGYTLTVRISDGRACVIQSDCPDKICVHTGWISGRGESVVCVPALLRLTVTDGNGGGGDADAVIG